MKTTRAARSLGVIVLAAGCLHLLSGCRVEEAVEELVGPAVSLTEKDRLLILAPHPDDETICCAGIIQQAVAMHLPVRVAFLTYGDNNQWSFIVYHKRPILMPAAVQRMGLVRHDEALAAAKALGLSPEELVFLGYPDFGTLQIWNEHWADRPPFRSMLTRVTAVPYPSALRPNAPYKGEDVMQDLKTVLKAFRPTKVFVSHPADHMPDHRALYLFTRVALWDLESEMRPELYPYLVHFKRWPRPRGFHPSMILTPPSALGPQIAWQTSTLSGEQIERKRTALKAHRTQYAYSGRLMLAFDKLNELFGDFPVVRLRPAASVSLSSSGSARLAETPEELTDEEQAAFIGLEWRHVRLQNGALVLSVEFSRPLTEAVSVAVSVFGYRSDWPFERMPKLHVKLDALSHAIYDQTQRLPDDTVRISRTPTRVVLEIPLSVLGNPRRVLTGARSYFSEVPLDWVSWRIVELPEPA